MKSIFSADFIAVSSQAARERSRNFNATKIERTINSASSFRRLDCGPTPTRMSSLGRYQILRVRKQRMSALGQKQTFAVQKGMSALPPKADMCGATRDVRFGP